MRTLLILATFIWAALAIGTYMGGKETERQATATHAAIEATR